MTKDQVIEAVNCYAAALIKRGYIAKRFTASGILPSQTDLGAHALWMCGEIPFLDKDGSMEKAMRWLGFVQASVWFLGLFSIEDMKGHNR